MKILTSLALLLLAGTLAAAETQYASHPPMRPLPVASTRPMPAGHVLFVDAQHGADTQAGTLAAPWQTIQFALKRLQPGDTLCLRAGTYYETPAIAVHGTSEAPITIRAHAGELVIIDSGLREFFEHPATAWEPVTDGAPDEFQSTKAYPEGAGYGNFGDSLVPLHRYINFHDFRSTNELWNASLGDRADDPTGIYCGPGVIRDPETGRMHVRLSHTQLAGLGANAYMGKTDPRKLPLVVTGAPYAVQVGGSQHLRLQDLVIRGAKMAALQIEKSEHIELDGLTLYGGMMAMRTGGVQHFRIVDCAFRGHAAPWHSRSTHKYRAGAGYLFDLVGSDIEVARCEFTDNHDFLALEGAADVNFHQCYVDNFNDDGFEPGPKREHGKFLIYQNLVSRVLSPITAHANKPNPVPNDPGSGFYWYRNVFDLRRGTYKNQPGEPDPSGAFLDHPTEIINHDHGSPTHEVSYVYQNTFLMNHGAFRGYYGFSWGAATAGTTSRVFNNIMVQSDGEPGASFIGIKPGDDFQADANLFWSVGRGPLNVTDIFQKFRASPLYADSKQAYPPGLGTNDRYADPKFRSHSYHPAPDSPAAAAGVPLPAEWLDPLRPATGHAPDLGAIPVAAEPWGVGVHGRIPLVPQGS